jgi:putative DNA methylase
MIFGTRRTRWRETCELNRNHPDAATLFNSQILPPFHDPFAGGGAIPLEAQRLGLESFASDLNPVAVTINKAMIEIPPRFAGRTPCGPVPKGERDKGLSRGDWPGATGLAEDVRRYGAWMRAEAKYRIGDLYPDIDITAEMAVERADLIPVTGQSLTVIAWLWARTVKSPNPAYSHVDVPLVSSFILSSKPGKEAYILPVIDGDSYKFTIKMGHPPESLHAGTTAGKRHGFLCLLSKSPIDYAYIRNEGKCGRMGQRLMAIVAESSGGRIFLEPNHIHTEKALSATPSWIPNLDLPDNPRDFKTPNYGLLTFGDLFTPRQLVALNTYSDLVGEAMDLCHRDALAAGLSSDVTSLDDGGCGAFAYAQSVRTYLALGLSRLTDICNSLCRWETSKTQVRNLFGRQAIPMIWDFAENNVFGEAAGDYQVSLGSLLRVLVQLPARNAGRAVQADAQAQMISQGKIVSTDPPYYDNIGYADLSDFFYIWLRRSLRDSLPELFGTLAVPKFDELVATPYRHGGKDEAELFFLQGMTKALHNLVLLAHPAFPVSIYYAFKQSDTDGDDATSSSGWVTFLDAVCKSGFSINGTWPMRTELSNRMIGSGTNALASSIVLVCRKRDSDAPTISRREFLRELSSVLPDALVDMTRGGVNSPVAPVDLSQAIIGPGMGIFTKYKAVLEADGKPMSVRTALQLINRFLADDEFDGETQFCIQWLESYGWKAADYGSADTLAQAKGAVLANMNREGLLTSGGGVVQLIRWQELNADWIPERHNLTPVWQALHQLIANLQTHGEQSTGALLAAMPAVSGRVRTLSYRLYTLAERKGLAEDARPYNELIGAWSAIELAAAEVGPIETQAELF